MKVGSIHKNSKTRYFAVGGYFSYEEDRIKIKAKYKKENLKLNQITTSKSNEAKLPHAGKENFVFIGAILILSTIFFYSRFRKFKDIK